MLLLTRGAAVLACVTLWTASLSLQAQGAAGTSPMPEGPGRSLVSTQCGNCHALDVALSKRVTPGEWSGGNVPSQLNESDEELQPSENCNATDDGDGGNDFYGGIFQESSYEQVGRSAKTKAEMMFNFSAQERGRAYTGLGDPVDPIPMPTGDSTPDSLGLQAFKTGVVVFGTRSGTTWLANGGSATTPQPIDRHSATLVNTDPKFYSFYAHVGTAAKTVGSLPNGTARTYGGDANECSIIGRGAHPQNRWNCDPAEWWLEPDHTPTQQPYHFGTLGDKYQLRDIDCDDGAIVSNAGPALGVPATLVSNDCDHS